MDTRAWIAVGLVIGLAWAAVPVFAEEAGGTSEIARAEAYAAEAFNAYSRKDYVSAIALYQKALEAAPSADILYNLARIYDAKLKNRSLAIEYYRRYALDTGADPNRLRVASLRLSELRELEAIAAANPAPADPVAAQAASAQPATRVMPPRAAAQSRGLSGFQVAGIVSGALGVAGLGVGIGFGFAAKNNVDVADRFCDGNACSTQRGVEASRDAANAATVSTIACVAGGALTLLGVTALLLGSGARQERDVAMLVVPYGAPDSLGAMLAARW